MCLECDAYDDADKLIGFLNKLLGTKFDYVGEGGNPGYKHAELKFREVSLYNR